MSIDSCYEGIIAKLTRQGKILNISKHLLTLTKNDERVLYVYELIGELNAFPKLVKVTKTDKVSTYYRNQGNKHFKFKSNCQRLENCKAWQYYNLSLLHAPLGSDNYCLALSNRSAAFFELKKYKECLKDIEKVLTLKYPDLLKDKLIKRKAACEEALCKQKEAAKSFPEIDEFLKFQGCKDDRYKCASTKLEVVYTEEMGRHVIAKQDIKVGEIIIQEQPYLVQLLKSQFLICCNYCLSGSPNLLPCDSCCFTLYCSEECKYKAYTEYHKFECPLMPTLLHMDFTKLELISLRILLKTRNDHASWPALFHAIEEAEANEKTEFHGHVKEDGNWVFDSKYYASIHTLASNVDKRSVSDIFQKAVTAAVFLRLLEKGTTFLNTDKVDEEKQIRLTVASMLLLHIMTCATNMHNIQTNTQDEAGNYTEEMSVATAPFAFHSLLNHSCSSNITRFSKLESGQMSSYAIRPIKKGTQLFDNYGSHYAVQDLASRQYQLKFQYKFTCLCEACRNNWPTYFALRSARNLPLKISKEVNQVLNPKVIKELQDANKSTAIKLFKPLCELAEKLDKYVPCKELSDVQESIKQCLVIFQGVVSGEYKTLVEWNAIPPNIK